MIYLLYYVKLMLMKMYLNRTNIIIQISYRQKAFHTDEMIMQINYDSIHSNIVALKLIIKFASIKLYNESNLQ